jgi:hypothetical protein
MSKEIDLLTLAIIQLPENVMNNGARDESKKNTYHVERHHDHSDHGKSVIPPPFFSCVPQVKTEGCYYDD